MPTIFDNIQIPKPNRSVFDLSHEVKMSTNLGILTPFLCQEVLPGDKFRVNTELLVRLAPLTAPMMHRVNVYTHFFFVPNRLLWSDWEKFITNGNDGSGGVVPPQFEVNWATDYAYFSQGSLADYLGCPVQTTGVAGTGTIRISELPFRAYQAIYNEYYRDQNLIPENNIYKTTGGVRTLNPQIKADLLNYRYRCWEKDYFTSALPWTQRGNPVKLPLAGSAPVVLANNNNSARVMNANNTTPSQQPVVSGTIAYVNSRQMQTSVDLSPVKIDPNGTLEANMSGVTSTTVNDLRTAFQLQKWLERNARAGARYIENILAHFGVMSSDARLQRPEYLGGGKSPILVSEVLQTSESSEYSPQGNMAGHGLSVQNSNSFERRFEEHGFIIGIMSVLPRTAYQQGLPRMFTRALNTDYFWPEFAHLGEQPVLNKELYVDPLNCSPIDDQTFGYQARYSEYRYNQSRVCGDFKRSLNFWHMGRYFTSRPALNATFVTCDPTYRPFAVTDPNVHHLWIQIYNNIQAVRPLPKMGNPGLIDH